MDSKVEKSIVMFTYSSFPTGSATANRIVNLAQTFRESGYKVIVMCQGNEREKDFDINKNKYFFKNIEYKNYSDTKLPLIKRIYNRRNIVKAIKNNFTKEEINNIEYIYFTYRNYNFLNFFSTKFFLKKKMIVDVMEWHSPEQYKYGRLNINYILHNYKIKNIIPLAKNIITISHYLKSFYKTRIKNVMVIPPQIDLKLYKNSSKQNNVINLIYAGTIGRKDYMNVVLDGLTMLSNDDLKKINFTLIGQNKNELKNLFQHWDFYEKKLGNSLNIIGRIPKESLEEKLKDAHFLVLMRPYSRYAQAGFPSKVPEALSFGLPVISNITSDLNLYIKDECNGYVVPSFDAESFKATIEKVLLANKDDYDSMSLEAYNTAKTQFDYKNFIEETNIFLQSGGQSNVYKKN